MDIQSSISNQQHFSISQTCNFRSVDSQQLIRTNQSSFSQRCKHQYKLIKTMVQSQTLFQQQEYEKALQKMLFLIEKIQVLKITESDSQSRLNQDLQIIAFYNSCCCFQKLWKFEECNAYFTNFFPLLEKSILEISQNHFKKLNLRIKAQLQFCAILSQANQHQKAFELAIRTIKLIKQLFKQGLNSLNKQIQNQTNLTKKGILSKQSQQGKQILEELISAKLYEQILAQQLQTTKSLKVKINFWKSNPQNNQKILRKQMSPKSFKHVSNSSSRNKLGLKQENNWLENFTIGQIMHMTPVHYPYFVERDNAFGQFSNRNLLQKIIYLSVSYFSLATQMRFIQNSLKKDKKHTNNQKQNGIRNSQILHLKAIQTLCKYVHQNSALVTHLINSYHKHYKQDLNTILQQNSIAQYSIINEIKKDSVQDIKTQLTENILIDIHGSTSLQTHTSMFQTSLTPMNLHKSKSKSKSRNKENMDFVNLTMIPKKKKNKLINVHEKTFNKSKQFNDKSINNQKSKSKSKILKVHSRHPSHNTLTTQIPLSFRNTEKKHNIGKNKIQPRKNKNVKSIEFKNNNKNTSRSKKKIKEEPISKQKSISVTKEKSISMSKEKKLSKSFDKLKNLKIGK